MAVVLRHYSASLGCKEPGLARCDNNHRLDQGSHSHRQEDWPQLNELVTAWMRRPPLKDVTGARQYSAIPQIHIKATGYHIPILRVPYWLVVKLSAAFADERGSTLVCVPAD